MRKQRIVKFPLSASNELKVRKYYKLINGLKERAHINTVFSKLIETDEIIPNNRGKINISEAYKVMGNMYNNYINSENDEITVRRKEVRKEVRKAKNIALKISKVENTLFTFIIHYELKTTYKQDYYETGDKKRYSRGDTIIRKESSNPETSSKKHISTTIDLMNYEDAYKIIQVLSARVEYLNTDKLIRDRKLKIKQPMRRSYILRNDWLKYSSGIANSAYEETDNKCVYNQLTQYLLNPPSGNPSKFVNKRRVSEESLFMFFQETIHNYNLNADYPDFTMESGVSAELIKYLCDDLKRNMYAFDESQQTFLSLTTNTSKNYSPIVYYKLHGHLYLIDDPSMIKSVATINSLKGNKILTSTLSDVKQENNMAVFHLDKYDVSKSKEMTEGIYLLNQSNLDDEIVEFIKTFKSIPRSKTNKSNIVEIKFEEGFYDRKKDEKKFVIVCIDATFADNFTYDQVKNVAESNNIKYVNEGIGSLILSILESGGKSCREYLTNCDKNTLIKSFGNVCNVCKLHCESYEIDHIIPLAGGGDNSISNLQPLCPKCHNEKTTEEKKNGAYTVKDIESSVFNKVVLDNIVKKNEWKTWSFVETVPFEKNGDIENIQTYKYDMRKCRKNITYYSKYEFPVYSVMDIPRPFSGVLQCGLFYVNTKNIYPFRGCGWYSLPIVEYGLSLHIIDPLDVKMEFLPSKILPATHFKKSIDMLMKAFEVEPNLQKLSINSLIGLFGKTKRSSSLTKFTLCPYEASQWWGDKNLKCEVFIKNVKLDDNEVLYNGIFSEQVDVEGMKYCLYKQVLEMEAMELHKLESVIKRNGGIILDRNTAAIRYAIHQEIEIVGYWDDEKTVLKYQKEGAKPLTCQMLPRLCREHELDLSVFNLHWNTKEDYECAEEEASNIVDGNKSVHIDGRAGTGKTYLVNKVIDELKSRGKKYMCFSPTNKGARLIGGNTIHSIYFKFKSNKKALFAKIEKIDYIFIDEVSMMVKDFYQLFILIKRSFPKINFIIAGDFGQLPPVNDDWTGDYENSPAMNGLCDGNRIKLMKCRRADRELFELCQSVETIDTSRFIPTEETYLNLAYTHETRIKVNNKCMNRFIKGRGSGIFIPKDVKNPKTQNITLMKGMPIIAHTTNKSLNVLNSQKFIITDVCNETFTIEIDDVSTKFKLEKFNKLFYLGFCITVHASQGETYNGKYTIHDWKFSRFCSKAKYVSLSRGTNINNIQIRN